ncbi:MCE family protein [Mycobacterium sp. OTB74]|uniref:MCE family protein n=1 Tax=Mycobacterium sp. OTB74 TaxID=1853452 RepID=UPI0024772D50|nr:MCE family protein [Mycobacterium sp. OTB74]
MTGRRRAALALLLIIVLAGAAGVIVHNTLYAPRTLVAYFVRAAGIYPGDEVRVAGVKVGTITSIEPQTAQAKITMAVDRDLPIRADAKAIIVAQNLVAARYVQLAPAYQSAQRAATLPIGAQIPLERTAVPIEWDQVKAQLSRLATSLAPPAAESNNQVSRFINTAANAMDGNGDKLRQTLTQLSAVGRVLASGSGDIVSTIQNLQVFLSAMRDSTTQIVQFQDRLATLSGVLDDSRSDLDSMLKALPDAIGKVQRFVAGSRDQTTEQIQRLVTLTQILVNHRSDVENILHAAPTSFANGYNIYNPNAPGPIGQFILNGISNPVQFLCGAIGGVSNVTASETSKLCTQYLGPALRLLNANYVPFPMNPILGSSATPDKITYADPRLAPGAAAAPPAPETSPAVSAYSGPNEALPQPSPPATASTMLLPDTTLGPPAPPAPQGADTP